MCSTDNALITLEKYIEGENLEATISDGILDLKTACRYAYQICNALSGLHAQNVIHRDIKPANIIIGNDANAYLIDLSIARMQNAESDLDTESLGTA